jgi:hypothetical protein
MKLIALSLVLRLQYRYLTNKIIPRCLFKNLASVMGWDFYLQLLRTTYYLITLKQLNQLLSSESTGCFPVQADIELWRRIILNTLDANLRCS